MSPFSKLCSAKPSNGFWLFSGSLLGFPFLASITKYTSSSSSSSSSECTEKK